MPKQSSDYQDLLDRVLDTDNGQEHLVAAYRMWKASGWSVRKISKLINRSQALKCEMIYRSESSDVSV